MIFIFIEEWKNRSVRITEKTAVLAEGNLGIACGITKLSCNFSHENLSFNMHACEWINIGEKTQESMQLISLNALNTIHYTEKGSIFQGVHKIFLRKVKSALGNKILKKFT